MCNKKLLFLLLALVLIVGIAACGATGGNTRDWDEHTLVYANLSMNGPDREAIDEFNRTHSDVQIEVRDYYDEKRKICKSRLLTEILAGRVPDIIDMGGSADASTTLLLGISYVKCFCLNTTEHPYEAVMVRILFTSAAPIMNY